MKLETTKVKKFEKLKITNMCKINITLPNNQWIKEFTRVVRKYFRMN